MSDTGMSVFGARARLDIAETAPGGVTAELRRALARWLVPHVGAFRADLEAGRGVTLALIPVEAAFAALAEGRVGLVAPEIEDGVACVAIVSEGGEPGMAIELVRAQSASLENARPIARIEAGRIEEA